MNLKNKIKISFEIVKDLKVDDLIELLTLFKYLLAGWKIFIIDSARIGNQLLNTLSFLSNISPEESSKYKFALSNPKRLSANIYFTNFWNIYLRKRGYFVFSGNLTTFVIEVLMKSTLTRIYKKHEIDGTKKFYLSTKRSINYVYHNRNDCGQIMNKEFKPFPKLNFKLSTDIGCKLKPFNYVCTYTRDSNYLNSLGFQTDFSYHDYRNDDYLKLMPTVEYLNSKNLSVVRMGNVKRNIDIKYFSQTHIDFRDLSDDGCDDIILFSNCLFYIGDTSGIALAANVFGRPVVRYNWIPIFNSVPHTSLVIPMLIKSVDSGEYLPFRKVWELKEKGLHLSKGDSYEKFGLQCIRNSTTDILDVSLEMLRRVQDNDFEPCHPLQKDYEKMMLSIGWHNPGIIGYSFMEKFGNLFL